MKSLFFSLYFSFYPIFSDTTTLETPLCTTPNGKFGWYFSFSGYLSTSKKQMKVTPSGDICNKRILQSNWSTYNSRTRIYPWDLHSKIDNINFHLSTFPAKINDKIFQNRGKSLICGNNGAYFVVFSQKEFFLKKSSSVQLQWSPSI